MTVPLVYWKVTVKVLMSYWATMVAAAWTFEYDPLHSRKVYPVREGLAGGVALEPCSTVSFLRVVPSQSSKVTV